MPTDQKISELTEDTSVTTADFVPIVTLGYAQTRKASLANILALGVSANYARSSPATRQVGGVNVGDSLTGLTWDQLAEKVLAPYTAPTITNTVLTPALSAYNDQNVTYNVTFEWSKNVGTPNLTGYQIKYRRGGSWINLSTTLTTIVGGSVYDASASVTLNTGGVDNSDVEFECEFTDMSIMNTSAIATAHFSAYAAPGISFSVGSTTRELGDISTAVTGTITRNSPNIALNGYQLQYQINGAGSWISYGSPISASGSSQGISVTHNDSSLAGSTSLKYRIHVIDAQQPTDSSTQNIDFLYNIFYGSVASAPTIAAAVRTLGNSVLSIPLNSFTLNTGTSNTKFCVWVPFGSVIVSVIDQDALNLDISAQYTAVSLPGNDFAGNAHAGKLYTMSQSIPYTTSHRHYITVTQP